MSDNDNFELVRRILTNIRSVRVFARETDFEQLLEMKEKFSAVIEERREEAEKEAIEREAREKKRQELLQLLAEEGFSAEELLGVAEDAPAKRKNKLPKAPPKYQFEEDGIVKYWSGRGRAPKPIDAALKAGQKLEDFLIKQTQP
ncbi:H-NS histone family protein (plasmid) [Erwinia amylovora]|jgi:DNA-binding protein StpA|uniref:H-NS histone family protein n=1 Tax=Erwinia amylovora TaxID=552 RepID=UPI001D06958F|nr:H-NS family nucleoid-associated regulatory protein [Erwinia amylovora]UDJ88614.1 H-NS histone family protein [Erwinia amylovora]UDK91362.1 H-NS histone family protein [Erwinia amylovora]UDK94719.1 H-NS histone family protein [Erwinia amylovora]UER93232.1 H-NS histone family protein [Erwinia amylovora]UOD76509.1 H-NS histone family protein [Erwinia amylovora]